jgi:hypothetical protein
MARKTIPNRHAGLRTVIRERSGKQRAAGNLRSPPPHERHRLAESCYPPQQPEPQQSSRSAFAPAVGHSSTQHSQVHFAHSQTPVSQQLQQSHFGQPPFRLPSITDAKGTRPSVAQSKKLFMEKLPVDA